MNSCLYCEDLLMGGFVGIFIINYMIVVKWWYFGMKGLVLVDLEMEVDEENIILKGVL